MPALDRFLPPAGIARSLSIQSILFATGEGAFLTGSAVFFTQIVGLSAAQVGLGMTVAMGVTFLVSMPMGRLADRVGHRRSWVLGAVGTAALYLTWPFIHGLPAFLAMMVVLELVNSFGSGGRSAYSLGIFTREERVRSLAFMRVALNVGFTLGAAIGGVALAFESDEVIRAVPWITAVVLFVNAFFISRLPDGPGDAVGPEGTGEKPAETAKERLVNPGALRNRGFLTLMFGDGILSSNQVLLNVVIPLWLVQETDAPRVLLAWLFGTNTLMAVLLQVAAARGIDSVDASLRASRISAFFMVLSCAIVLVTHDTVGWITIALVWLGHVTVTGAELFQSAGHWGFMSELSDPDRRGEYSGAARLGGTLGEVWAPAAYTWLALEWGTPGWITIAVIVVLGCGLMHPAARSAQRYLERHGVQVDR